MAIERTAKVVWEGDLPTGSGNIEFETGALQRTPVTWASRTEQPGGKTSPEELLAASHASCYSMALSATLGRAKKPPTKLSVTAKCSLERVADGFKVTTMDINVVGEVPGMSESEFKEIAAKAEMGCPISNALRNNVKVNLVAELRV